VFLSQIYFYVFNKSQCIFLPRVSLALEAIEALVTILSIGKKKGFLALEHFTQGGGWGNKNPLTQNFFTDLQILIWFLLASFDS